MRGETCDLLLRRARLGSDTVDLAIAAGTIQAIALSLRHVRRREEVDLAGRTVVGGLCDAHIHFWSWARQRRALDLSSAASPDEAANLVADFVNRSASQVIRGYYLDHGLWPQAPERSALDKAAPGRPVILVNRDWHSAWLSSTAFQDIGVEPTTTGILVEEAAWRAIDLLTPPDPGGDRESAADAIRELARRGITEIVDFELHRGWERWQALDEESPLQPLRVWSAVPYRDLDTAVASGRSTGSGAGLLRTGPVKLFADGALGSCTAWCDHPYGPENSTGRANLHGDQLVSALLQSHRHGFTPAVHAIGDAANREVLNAFQATGVRGRIEHCQLLDDSDVPRFRQLGITASVQPLHVLDDQELLARHWSDRRSRSYRIADLIASGADVIFGSDAPVAEPDPWQAIAVATAVEPLPDFRPVEYERALSSSSRRRVAVGEQADLVVLDRDPALHRPRSYLGAGVVGTIVAGRWAYRSF